MKTVREILACAAIVLCICLLLGRCWKRGDVVERVEYRTDTLRVRDTVWRRISVPISVTTTHSERFTVRLPKDVIIVSLPGDTVEVPVYLPIEQKRYATEDYDLVVEGWQPKLVSLTLFPETRYVTNTGTRTIVKRHRWGIGVHAGYGFDGRKLHPYIGVGLQYDLWSF